MRLMSELGPHIPASMSTVVIRQLHLAATSLELIVIVEDEQLNPPIEAILELAS